MKICGNFTKNIKGIKMENKYYVYVYKRKDNNDVFYVGKGCGQRCKNINDHNEYCVRICNKYGVNIEKIKENLSEEEALKLEKETISYYVNELGYSIALDNKRDRKSEHFLCNHTLGGEGNIGCHRMSEEEREKRRQNLLGDKNIAKRPEVREKISKHARENNSFCKEDVKKKIRQKQAEYYSKEENRIKHSERLKNFYKTEKGIEIIKRNAEKRKGKMVYGAISIYCLEDGIKYESITNFSNKYGIERHKISKILKQAEENGEKIALLEYKDSYLHISKIPFKE